MSEANAAVIGGVYEAFGRGDIPAMLEMLDESITWRAPENLPHGGSFSGRDGVAQFFQGLGERWDGLVVDSEGIVSEGDRVVVLSRVRGTFRATGEDTGYASAHVWTLRDGTPVRFDEYVDAPTTLPAAG